MRHFWPKMESCMQLARLGLSLLLMGPALMLGCGTSTSNTPMKSPASQVSSTTAAEKPATEETPKKTEEPALEVKELNWDQLQELIATHKGKVVVVDIWSTSCEPCIREFPHLVELQKRHGADVVCISFDCDFIGAKNKSVDYYHERVLKQLTSLHADNLTNVMCTKAADELFVQIDVDSIPAVFVYDRTGKLSKRFDNRTPASATEEGISYEKQIDPLVADLVKAAN